MTCARWPRWAAALLLICASLALYSAAPASADPSPSCTVTGAPFIANQTDDRWVHVHCTDIPGSWTEIDFVRPFDDEPLAGVRIQCYGTVSPELDAWWFGGPGSSSGWTGAACNWNNIGDLADAASGAGQDPAPADGQLGFYEGATWMGNAGTSTFVDEDPGEPEEPPEETTTTTEPEETTTTTEVEEELADHSCDWEHAGIPEGEAVQCSEPDRMALFDLNATSAFMIFFGLFVGVIFAAHTLKDVGPF